MRIWTSGTRDHRARITLHADQTMGGQAAPGTTEEGRPREHFNAARRGFASTAEQALCAARRTPQAKAAKGRALVHGATLAAATSTRLDRRPVGPGIRARGRLIGPVGPAGDACPRQRSPVEVPGEPAEKPGFFDAQHAHYRALDAAQDHCHRGGQAAPLIRPDRELAQSNDFGHEQPSAPSSWTDWSHGLCRQRHRRACGRSSPPPREEFWDKRRA